MRRRRRRLRRWALRGPLSLGLAAVTATLAVSSAAAAPAAEPAPALRIAPVGRVAFPDRAWIVGAADGSLLGRAVLRVSEDDRPVQGVAVTPFASAGVSAGTVIALDASESMAGEPFAAGLAAARRFAAERGSAAAIGVVAFNGRVTVLQRPTSDAAAVARALGRPPALAYGTRLADAVARSLDLLSRSGVASGTVVVLSDGADVGSSTSLQEVMARARARDVRVFTVGLRSGAYASAPLRRLASSTGGAYAEATTPAALAPLYASLGRRLAGEVVVRYRSSAAPGATVAVTVTAAGAGSATTTYEARPATPVAAYQRSLLTRLALSPVALLAVSLAAALLVAVALLLLLRRGRSTLVERIGAHAPLSGRAAGLGDGTGQDGAPSPSTARRRASLRAAAAAAAEGATTRSGWWARLERDLEITATPRLTARRVVATTAAGTVLAVGVLAAVSPIVAVLGLLVPLLARGLVRRRLSRVRDAFADQLSTNLQVLASAMRAGHGFAGALAVVVEHAQDPSQRELRRALSDAQLGAPLEDALRRVAERMASRDLEQVALLSELQRTVGGNAAEVLDTVVETMRERADLRLVVRSLTAQGRMARWILTGIPVLVAAFLTLIQPELMQPLFESAGGQVALVAAGLMVIAGSLVIQRIVDVKA